MQSTINKEVGQKLSHFGDVVLVYGEHFPEAREARTGRTVDLSLTSDVVVLFVTYDAPAVLGLMMDQEFPIPTHILDLNAEFRCHVSGLNADGQWSFETALNFYGVPGHANLASLEALLGRMLPYIDLERALLRGRYTAAVARMERIGVPIDPLLYERLKSRWPALRVSLIERVDADYGVFDGATFRESRWEQWVEDQGIPWERLPSGGLRLDDDTFEIMSTAYQREVGPMWELRKTLNKLRFDKLAVGADGRNRTPLRLFASKTGRNQPSTNQFIFGAPSWVRGLIRPEPGQALAYVDYEQQEFGIAAALSGDGPMTEAYLSGDPYLEFAKQCGAVPPRATKESHREERERYKLCALGIQYGMGARSLATVIKGTEAEARGLIENHKFVYRCYWEWSALTCKEARRVGRMTSAFGWNLNVREGTRPGTVRNFPLQANGAEILRIACCLLTERGIRICAPVHDAVLIEASIAEIEGTVAACQEVMAEAGRIVLDGFTLRTDATTVRYPDRYATEKGGMLWNWVYENMGHQGT